MSDATNVAGALAVSEAGVRVGAAVLLEGVTARFAPVALGRAAPF